MISLESVAPPGLEEPVEEPVEQEQAEDTAESAESAEQAEPEQTEPEIVEPEPPAPKRRGRPKAEPATPQKKAAKAAPPAKAPATRRAAPKTAVRMKKPVVYESSSSEDDMPINKDDMDTMLLSYLLQRKHAQQDHRRTMWAQMARLS